MSEFGKGLTYCLGLFLCHSERNYNVKDKEAEILERPELWFYVAADHIFELEIPLTLSKSLQNRLKRFKNKVLGWRLCMNEKDNATIESKTWAIQEAKDLLRLIDKHYGVKVEKGQ